MKVKTLMIVSTTVLLGAAFLPAANAQDDDGPRFERPLHGEHGRPRFGRGPEGQGRPGPRRPGGDPERLIETLDSDGDGFVSLDEFLDRRLARVDAEFERRDRDGDGLLSEEEARRPQRRERPHDDATEREQVIACVRETIADWAGPRDVEDRFDVVDSDGDGYIDLAELSTALETRAHDLFDHIDADADGLISLVEVQAHQDEQINLRRVVRACIDEVTDPFETTL